MEEKILLEVKVMWYKKKLQAFPGVLKITNSTLTFSQDRINVGGVGLLGSLVASSSKKTRGGELVNEKLENLTFNKGKSMGKKNYILEVGTPDNQTFNFLVDDSMMDKVKEVISLQ
jgi:hypothetical protein